jgi:hypothetical protein
MMSRPVTGPERSISRCKILRIVAEGLNDESLEIEHDVDYVFNNTGNGGEFMSDAFDAYSTYSRTIERRKKNSSLGRCPK